MARVIELRAWNKYHKKMHSVYEINFDHSIAKTRDDETGGTYTFGFIDLELMQFAGLHDKNGVKIFEGDIVICPNYSNGFVFGMNQPVTIQEVKIIDACVKFYGMGFPPYKMEKITVIGNIHQNPELLEKK